MLHLLKIFFFIINQNTENLKTAYIISNRVNYIQFIQIWESPLIQI